VLTVVLFLMTHYWVLCRLCHEGPLFFTHTHTHTHTDTTNERKFTNNPSQIARLLRSWFSLAAGAVTTAIL